MPNAGVELTPSSSLLSTQEILRLSKLFVQNGITKIRLTGGEPTIRKDFVDIVSELNKLRPLGLQSIGVTSNGIALKRKLPALKDCGLDQVNLSLDTLDPFKFELITRRKGHHAVLESLQKSIELGFETKMNVVVIKNFNSSEVVDFVRMTKELPVYIRFIEYMPFDGNKWNSEKFEDYQSMLQRIKTTFQDVEKSIDSPNDTSKVLLLNKAYTVNGYRGKFGFITSMSEHFCGTCNRLRLLADGNMKVCLFGNSEVNLRDLMRATADDDELAQVIMAAGNWHINESNAKRSSMLEWKTW